MAAPLCFVVMPFGDRTDAAGRIIRFDQVYEQVVRPAIEDAGMAPIRADEDGTPGIGRKPIYERLLLCDFAVADLTTAHAGTLFELGVRHAVRPGTTVLLLANESVAPAGVDGQDSLAYDVGANGLPAKVAAARAGLRDRLNDAREARHASGALLELLRPIPPPIEHLKTNTLQDLPDATQQEREVRAATTLDELKALEAGLGGLDAVETAVLLKLLLAYRDHRAWQAMIDLAAAMPEPVARTPMVREQLALALNRAGRADEAEQVITTLIREQGGSSERYAILGRIGKDRWQKADEAGARRELDRAIDAYLKGFEADWRDALPGVNAVTLMELRNPPDPRRLEILPIVRYAASRRIAAGTFDYWDHATLLELAVLGKNEREATQSLTRALPIIRAKWEPESTLDNLRMIRAARRERNEDEPAWIGEVMAALEAAAQ